MRLNEIFFSLVSVVEAKPLLIADLGSACGSSAGNSRVLHHRLIDGAEDRAAVRIEHFDANPVAEFQERRVRLAGADRLDRALLGNAGIAETPLGDRQAGPAALVLVRYRAGSDARGP